MMTITDRNLTVREAVEYLALNGVHYHEVYFRTLVGLGKVKSFKIYSSRVIPREELARIVREHKEKR